MSRLEMLYVKEISKFCTTLKKEQYTLQEIDFFHSFFLKKYKKNWNDIEKLMLENNCDDSIELFSTFFK